MSNAAESFGVPRRSTAGARGNGAMQLEARHERLLTSEERASVRDALDMLALALTDAGHVWTDGERSAYERAIEILD